MFYGDDNMALSKISYENKVSLNEDSSIINKNKITDSDMNEIKSVVNNIVDNFGNYTKTSELSSVSLSGDYEDLNNKPTLPIVYNGILNIKRNNISLGTFSANSNIDNDIDIEVPVQISQLINDSGYITQTNLEEAIDDFINTRLEEILLAKDKQKYPIGVLEFNVSGVNPLDYLKFGTWELWGQGRVPVCIDLSQTEFNEVEKIGGEKAHTLSISEIPSHNHTANSTGAHTHNVKALSGSTSGSGSCLESYGSGAPKTRTINGAALSAGAHTHTISNTGEGNEHNNLQPYITCYIWKRVS